MLGKIPLVRGFHVIFTKFHDCVLHIRVPTECPRTTTGTPVSPSVAVNANFRGYLQFLYIGFTIRHGKPFRWSILISLLKKTTYIQLQREREGGGLCSKIRTADTGVVHCRRDKKRVQFRSHSIHKVEKSHTQCSLDIPRQTMT